MAAVTNANDDTTTTNKPVRRADLVIIDYEDIASGDDNAKNEKLFQKLEAAFGKGHDNSTGIIGIRNVPGFVQAKQELLPLMHSYVHLPAEYLSSDKCTHKESLYNTGWSFGKEMLKPNKPDENKGSFYFNPITDQPGTLEDQQTYPISYPPNLWPTDLLPQLQPKAQHLGCIMKDVVVHLSKYMDEFIQQKLSSQQQNTNNGDNNEVPKLYNLMKDTEKVKGRLLYYYPLQKKEQEQEEQNAEDSWIGWHNDSGFFTALAGDLYVDHTTGEPIPEEAKTELLKSQPPPGLYVMDRNNELVSVVLPPDCMAVQIGECIQILSGGEVIATPHCVRGPSAACGNNMARISLACFIDTPPTFPLTIPKHCSQQELLDGSALVNQSRVPPLDGRWENGVTFGQFLQQTFERYYNWK